ncbi:hypothetical protein, partial [Neisseria canis]|uniref:hypothetical protein n=1 Tax=Neisseria canis TaxID=493 RepID=UPI001B801067
AGICERSKAQTAWIGRVSLPVSHAEGRLKKSTNNLHSQKNNGRQGCPPYGKRQAREAVHKTQPKGRLKTHI